jgi:mannose-6-phosphate isomerase-like protein (cupin superfamily)
MKMNELKAKVRHGGNFSMVQLGAWKELKQYKMTKPVKSRGKVFLKELLNLTSMEVSMNWFPAGVSMPFYHKHQENEELYIFVKGKGQFFIDGEHIDIKEGSIVRVGLEGVRAWRNHSQEDLYFIVIQAKSETLSSCGIKDGVPIEGEVTWQSGNELI